LRVNVIDHDVAPISDHFKNSSNFIEKALESKGKVYVHCVDGKSRSPTILMAYLMKW